MKRKLMLVLFSVVAALCCAFAFAACSVTSSGANGTYYLYENGQTDKSQYIKLDGDKWSDDDNASGTYKKNGSTVTFYAEVFGSNEEMFSGTLDGNKLEISVFGDKKVYYKDGTAPSGGDDKPKAEYTVTYDANGGTFADSQTTVTQKVKEGETLTAPASPTRAAASFGGWSTEKNGSTLWKFATDTVKSDTTLYAVWNEQSAVIISADGAKIDEKEKSIFMLVGHDIDSVSLSSKIVCSSDSVWKLYYDKLGQTEIPTKIAAGKSGELENGNNVFYIVVTSQNGSQVNVYELNIHRSYLETVTYYDNKDNVIYTDEFYTGDEYVIDYTPSIDGYTFNHWKESGKEITKFTSLTAVSLHADCTVKTYVATLKVDGGEELAKTDYVLTYDENYSLPVPERTGYTFLGWRYKNGTMLTDGNGDSLDVWTNSGDINLYASWQANNYVLTLETDSDVMGTVTGNGEYACGDDVTITASANAGYTFIGWYNGENELTKEPDYTFAMPAGNVTYTAKWQMQNEFEIFDFKSTTTTCEITGVKDKTLTSVAIPDSVTSIGYAAFSGCSELTSIIIPNSVTSIGSDAFLGTAWYNNQPDGIVYAGKVAYKYKGTMPDNTSITLKDGTTGIAGRAFSSCSKLTRITIPDSVTSIGNDAFIGCSGLANVKIPDSVASIGNQAFYRCSGLTSVTIGNSVISIGDETFYDCSGLTSVTIGNSVTSIGDSAFSGCSRLTSINYTGDIASWCAISNISNLMSYGSTTKTIYIDGKEIRGELTIPNSVTSISSSAFRGCSRLTSVTIGNSVTSIDRGAFYNCYGLMSVTIGNSVASIGSDAFWDCSELTSVTIPESVTSIGIEAFRGCNKLTNINYKGDIAGWCTINGIYGLMRYGATSKTLYIGGKELAGELVIPDSITSIGWEAFKGCRKLTSITIPDSVISIGRDAFYNTTWYNNQPNGLIYAGKVAYKYKGTMPSNTFITIKNGTNSIAVEAFRNCSGLTSITIPDSVTSIGSYAFWDCSGLTSITIPDSVTSIGGAAFLNCSGLTSVTIGNSVTSIGMESFSGCRMLTSIKYTGDIASWCALDDLGNLMGYASTTKTLYIDGKEITGELIIPDMVTSIGNHAFHGCSGLTSITIPNSVTSIGDYAFYGCSGLTSITIPNSVTSIGDWVFYGCSGLTNIAIPDSVTSIGDRAFEYCRKLTSITIPDTVTSIGDYAFYGCSGLTSIAVPFVGNTKDGTYNTHFGYIFGANKYENNYQYVPSSLKTVVITGGTSIGSNAFFGSGLTSITIPDSVTSIGDRAFYDCSWLTEINFNGTIEQWKAIEKNSYWDYNTGEYTVHCKDGDLSKSES